MKLPADAMPFLSELKYNNNREWFNDQKSRFKALQEELIDFIGDLIGELIPYDPLLVHVEAKDCLFRIHKDARFAKDKTPYKTHFGIHIVSSGRRSDFERAGFYLHIEPGDNCLAGGAHSPSPDWLRRIRHEITHNGDALEAILANKQFKKYFAELRGAQLVRPPKGFDADTPHLGLIKRKALWVQHNFSDEVLWGKNFDRYFTQVFEAYQPFQGFLNAV